MIDFTNQNKIVITDNYDRAQTKLVGVYTKSRQNMIKIKMAIRPWVYVIVGSIASTLLLCASAETFQVRL